MKRLINRLAWRLVRATSSSAPKRPACLFCRKRHRTDAAWDACRDRFHTRTLAILARRSKPVPLW